MTTPFFRITIVDEKTGRGIPLARVQLNRYTDYWTDSAGMIAFLEPDLMGKRVHIHVQSVGYHLPIKPEEYEQRRKGDLSGMEIYPAAGGSVTIALRRDMIAERLYRITGSDIYRDSKMLGDATPPTRDETGSLVTGQDTVDMIPYKGKYFWLWGDTDLSDRHTGNYKTTCGSSEFPENGGLDPNVGIQIQYFRVADGSPKPMVDMDNWMIWIMGLRLAKDAEGNEHLLTDYANVRGYLEIVERGMVEYNDQRGVFEQLYVYPKDAVVRPNGIVFRYAEKGIERFYHCDPWPNVRSKTDYASQKDLGSYEAFTCLKEGARFDGSAEQLDRDGQGRLRWAWKQSTSPMDENGMQKLIEAGHMQPEEQWYCLRDVETNERVVSHAGCVKWNSYRGRWVSIRSQNYGKTMLGETWYFEADTPLGPWVYGQKIVTHALPGYPYSFYNPAYHPEFDKEGGRIVYFQGTYTHEFSGGPAPTPRYNYNQIMYKADLGDARLFLPVPVYRIGAAGAEWGTKREIPGGAKPGEIVCFAPDRPRAGCIAVYERRDAKGKPYLSTEAGEGGEGVIRFYGVTADAEIPKGDPLGLTVALYEYEDGKTGERRYSTDGDLANGNLARSEKPVCRVWPNPIWFDPYAVE